MNRVVTKPQIVEVYGVLLRLAANLPSPMARKMMAQRVKVTFRENKDVKDPRAIAQLYDRAVAVVYSMK